MKNEKNLKKLSSKYAALIILMLSFLVSKNVYAIEVQYDAPGTTISCRWNSKSYYKVRDNTFANTGITFETTMTISKSSRTAMVTHSCASNCQYLDGEWSKSYVINENTKSWFEYDLNNTINGTKPYNWGICPHRVDINLSRVSGSNHYQFRDTAALMFYYGWDTGSTSNLTMDNYSNTQSGEGGGQSSGNGDDNQNQGQGDTQTDNGTQNQGNQGECLDGFIQNGNICEALKEKENGTCPTVQSPLGIDITPKEVADKCYYRYAIHPEDGEEGFDENKSLENQGSGSLSSDKPNQWIPQITTPHQDYDNVCANESVKDAVSFIGRIMWTAIYVIPIIISVLGMIDFVKAVIASDEKAQAKAASTLIKRVVAGVITIIIPTLMPALLDVIELTNSDYIKELEYESCINCLLEPFGNECSGTAEEGK